MTTTSQHPAYQPSGDELLIFEFAKMQGKTQSQVASFFGINQSTVSRIIHRIERWQAHAKARENGRLDPHERLRAQRWLTYERNELILASCLRIAHEMEGFTELSKSTISRPASDPTQETKIRTEGRTIDRHGVAARFLRLAWRINMDQLKLTEILARDGDLPTEPLTDDELATELHQAALDAAELASARHGAKAAISDRGLDEPVGWAPPTVHGQKEQPSDGEIPTDPPSDPPSLRPSVSPSPPPVHNPHDEMARKTNATPAQPCSCVLQIRVDKNSLDTCITESDDDSRDCQPPAIEPSEAASAPLAAT